MSTYNIEDKDWEKGVIEAAKKVIQQMKEKQEEDARPKMTWQKFGDWLIDALDANPNIKITVTGTPDNDQAATTKQNK